MPLCIWDVKFSFNVDKLTCSPAVQCWAGGAMVFQGEDNRLHCNWPCREKAPPINMLVCMITITDLLVNACYSISHYSYTSFQLRSSWCAMHDISISGSELFTHVALSALLQCLCALQSSCILDFTRAALSSSQCTPLRCLLNLLTLIFILTVLHGNCKFLRVKVIL